MICWLFARWHIPHENRMENLCWHLHHPPPSPSGSAPLYSIQSTWTVAPRGSNFLATGLTHAHNEDFSPPALSRGWNGWRFTKGEEKRRVDEEKGSRSLPADEHPDERRKTHDPEASVSSISDSSARLPILHGKKVPDRVARRPCAMPPSCQYISCEEMPRKTIRTPVSMQAPCMDAPPPSLVTSPSGTLFSLSGPSTRLASPFCSCRTICWCLLASCCQQQLP